MTLLLGLNSISGSRHTSLIILIERRHLGSFLLDTGDVLNSKFCFWYDHKSAFVFDANCTNLTKFIPVFCNLFMVIIIIRNMVFEARQLLIMQ